MTNEAIRAALHAFFVKYQVSGEDAGSMMELVHEQALNALREVTASLKTPARGKMSDD